MRKKKPNVLKGIVLTVVFILCVLILAYSILQKSEHNIIGKAFYEPIKIYGKIVPAIPDNTEIKFKVEDLVIASGLVKDNKYGIEEEISFEMDDPLS